MPALLRSLCRRIALAAAFMIAAAPGVRAATYEPLDCDKASSPAQTTICKTYGLGQDEARMATLFAVTTSLVGMGQRGDIGESQRAWLKSRETCGADAACLAKAYRTRIEVLQKVLDGIVARGPF